MSTRGAVAIRQDDGTWKGVYNRYDSYPTGLGRNLFKVIDNTGNLEQFAEDLLLYDTWENFVDQDLDIGNRMEHIKSDKNPNPLYLEWVYVIDVKNKKLKVLTNKDVTDKVGTKDISQEEKPKKVDGGWHYGHCVFKHEKVAEYDLSKGEPDWQKLEEKIYNINSD